MENCPYCGKPFKRLKSHLPHCKMAGDVKTNSVVNVQSPVLTADSRTVTAHSTGKWKKQNKDLPLIKNTSKGGKKRITSDSPSVGTEGRLQLLQEVHTAGSEREEGKGKPMKGEYQKRQTDETKQTMTQEKTKSLTETIKGVQEMKHVKDRANSHKKKGQVISSQTNVLPKSTLTLNKGKFPVKGLLVQNPTQHAVKSREVRLKSPNQESKAEPLDVSISVLQSLTWNQNHKDKMTDGQQRQTARTSMDECTELEYGGEPHVSASHHEIKGSNLKPWEQWEDCKKENNPTESSCRNEGQAEGLGDAVCKNSRGKKQGAVEEDKHPPSHPNCITVSAKPLPDFTSTQPSLLTSEKEEKEGVDTIHAKVMQTPRSEEDSSWSVLRNLELKVPEEHPVKQSSSLTLNDKQTCAVLPSGGNTIHSRSLGLQYFPEFYDSYLRLRVSSERPLCQNKIVSGRWQATLSEVSLSEGRVLDVKLRELLSWPASRGISATKFPAAVYKAWDRRCNKFLNTRKVGAGGITVLVAGCCVLSFACYYELIKLDRWRKDP
ncbi:mitochondrial nucleoid-associated protein 1 [Microcaecilia unicolor]|uniref:Uncharacterized protein C17orf80 homolog n=1 Tax=Microcaecilia unicolor TaxID=1415580 RepID=A0A6P7YA99_9AMPH|nr:uncharacterized protein C17orf80 homolog [Microcaecilia unicolor]